MVNTGTPSKGCVNCRERRIKCDQGTPSCGQCRRSQRVCLGYRNQLDLLFHDESANIARKVKRQQSNIAEAASSSRSGITESSGRSGRRNARIGSMNQSRELQPRRADINFFLLHFSSPKPSPVIGMWTPVHLLDPKAYPIVALCVKSVGMAGMANTIRSSNHADKPLLQEAYRKYGQASIKNATQPSSQVYKPLLREASRKYGQSLSLMNEALKNINKERAREIVLAGILLALFEGVSCTDSAALGSWLVHVKGIGSLMQLCISELFNTGFGLRAFCQLRGYVINRSFLSGTPVPEPFSQWPKTHLPPTISEDYQIHMRVRDLMVDACTINHQILTSTSDNSSLISSLHTIDRGLDNWATSLPSSWLYTIYEAPKTPEDPTVAQPTQFHSYPSNVVGDSWNRYRHARIFVNELLLKLYSSSSATTTSSTFDSDRAIQLATSVIVAMVTQICESVNHFFPLDAQPGAAFSNGLGPAVPRIGSAFILHGPLFAAGKASVTEQNVRNWCIRVFKSMWETLGIGASHSFAVRLEERSCRSP